MVFATPNENPEREVGDIYGIVKWFDDLENTKAKTYNEWRMMYGKEPSTNYKEHANDWRESVSSIQLTALAWA